MLKFASEEVYILLFTPPLPLWVRLTMLRSEHKMVIIITAFYMFLQT